MPVFEDGMATWWISADVQGCPGRRFHTWLAGSAGSGQFIPDSSPIHPCRVMFRPRRPGMMAALGSVPRMTSLSASRFLTRVVHGVRS
jgi:hypothetical protein